LRVTADTRSVRRDEQGFLMVELLTAMVVLGIALTALVTLFSTAILEMRSTSQQTTADFLADAQMETFRAMTSRDIGLDLSAATVAALDSTYTADPACVNPTIQADCTDSNGVSGTETPPTGTLPDSCTTIDAWYPNTLPCEPSRVVSATTTPASPDGHTYRIDTYVVELAATTTGTLQQARKEVTVVVRDGSQLSRTLARESSTFDCATGATPGSIDC
jgi:Tfp pilus assembly protein PilV